jgi:hypothetical protein
MNAIALEDYLRLTGRNKPYSLDLSTANLGNATRMVELANELLGEAALAGVIISSVSPLTKTFVSSGWRPPIVNAATPNAAPNSKHMTCQAIDIYDPDGDLDDWLMTPPGQLALKEIGLWMEHPASTKTWSHLQMIPPNSQKRVFYP